MFKANNSKAAALKDAALIASRAITSRVTHTAFSVGLKKFRDRIISDEELKMNLMSAMHFLLYDLNSENLEHEAKVFKAQLFVGYTTIQNFTLELYEELHLRVDQTLQISTGVDNRNMDFYNPNNDNFSSVLNSLNQTNHISYLGAHPRTYATATATAVTHAKKDVRKNLTRLEGLLAKAKQLNKLAEDGRFPASSGGEHTT